MNSEEMLALIKPKMTAHRYTHTLGVRETAVQLAKQYGANTDQAEIAAIFHDYCKFRDPLEMEQIIRLVEEIPKDLLDYDKELWHAPVGAYLVKKEVGIDDEQVLAAICYHTTGREKMSLLEKIVFLADYIEPGRHFPGVEEVRTMAQHNLDQAVWQALTNTIRFLEKKKQKIYPLTMDAYRDLERRVKKSIIEEFSEVNDNDKKSKEELNGSSRDFT